MVVADRENLRIRLDPSLKERFSGLCDRKNIKQQTAIEALVRFLVGQESDLAQSMILGQTAASDEVLAVALRQADTVRADRLDARAGEYDGENATINGQPIRSAGGGVERSTGTGTRKRKPLRG